MKKTLFYFLSFMVLASCNQSSSSEAEVAKTIITGKLMNPVNDKFYISSGESVNEIAVDENGNFNDTLQLAEGFYGIRHARESGALYIAPGKNVNLSVDMKNFDETLKFDGASAAANNYLAKKTIWSASNRPNSREFYGLDEAEFVKEVSAKKASYMELLESATDLPASFVANEKQNIEYENLAYYMSYKSAHSYFTKKEDFEQPAAFAEKIAAIDYTDEKQYLTFPSYQRLVSNHFTELMGDNGEKTASFLEAFNTINSPVIKSGLAAAVSYYVKPGNENATALFSAIMENSTDEELKEKLTKKHELIQGLAKGMPSPEFDYQDIKGKNIALKDLEGKNVYIDVWATWCGPCKAEIPHLKEMEKAHHGKNIEFVSISIDKQKDFEKWQNMVADKELKGVQLFSDNDWKSEFVQEYAIEGIPRFILVDDHGKIVSADAPRPSQQKQLMALFEETGVN